MTERYPVVPLRDGVPAFDHRAPSPLLQRGIARLEALTQGGKEPLWLLSIFEARSSIDRWNDITLVENLAYLLTHHSFHSIDVVTGIEQWSFHRGADDVRTRLYGTVRLTDQIVYLQTEQVFTAIDAASGERLWDGDAAALQCRRDAAFDAAVRGRVWAPSDPDGVHIWSGHSIPKHGLVEISSYGWFGDDLETAICITQIFDARTGEEYWSLRTLRPFETTSVGNLMLIYYQSVEAPVFYIDAYSPENGNLVWTTQIENDLSGTPTFMGQQGVVIIESSDYRNDDPDELRLHQDHVVYFIDAASGEHMWHVNHKWDPRSAPPASDGIVYITRPAGHVAALDLWTGHEKWTMERPTAHWSCTPEATYFRNDEDTLVAKDAQSGFTLWEFRSLSQEPDFITASNGLVYVNTHSAFHALDETDGMEQWRLKYEGIGSGKYGGGKYGAIIQVVGNGVYVANYSGPYWYQEKVEQEANQAPQTLYSLESNSGRVKWYITGRSPWIHRFLVDDNRVYITSDETLITLEVDTSAKLKSEEAPLFHFVNGKLIRLA